MSKARIAVGALSVSMAAFVAIVSSEGYTDNAVIPTKGDVPTYGFGSTVKEDGSKVQMGETIRPQRAVVLAAAHISKDESAFRASLPNVALYQGEYDVYLDWTYQFGTGAWNKSAMRQELMAGNYKAACDALLAYRFSAGFDCSTPGNKVCHGVWTRQQKRHADCLAAGN